MAYSNLKKDINTVQEIYPKLKASKTKGNTYVLSGEIDIFDADDIYRGSFSIELKTTSGYPYRFPLLYETEGKIPRIEDRHMYKDAQCCVTIMQKEEIRAKRGITIVQYMNEYTIPFFANQIFFETYGKWANGDYKHGIKGILQYYQELLEIEDKQQILKEIKNAIEVSQKNYEPCYCGSKKKYKKCHLKQHREIKKVSPNRLIQDYKLIQSIFKLE